MNKEAIQDISFMLAITFVIVGFMVWYSNGVDKMEEQTKVTCGVTECYLEANINNYDY